MCSIKKRLITNTIIHFRFEMATARDKVSELRNVSPEPAPNLDGGALSVVHKKTRPRNGVLVTLADGSTAFHPEGVSVPDPSALPPGASFLPGRMECGPDGQTFVPGMSMELNGVKSFIPGKVRCSQLPIVVFTFEQSQIWCFLSFK